MSEYGVDEKFLVEWIDRANGAGDAKMPEAQCCSADRGR